MTCHSHPVIRGCLALYAGLLGCLVGLPRSACAEDLIHSLGPGPGVLRGDERDRICDGATLLLNAQGEYSSSYCVRWDFLEPPEGGAFAECYSGEYEICGFVLDLSCDGGVTYQGQTLELILWDDSGDEPGGVRCITTGIQPEGIGIWPEITRHEFEIPGGCCTTGNWWAGMRSEWEQTSTPCYWYYASAPSSGANCCKLRVPPGIGPYPEGWQPVSLIFGEECPAMGVGVLVRDCSPTPSGETTWGRVKSLNR
jgi:hypothetical protein